MPRYQPTTAPDPDQLGDPIVGMAIDAPAPHDSGLHRHCRAQLMYAVSGVLQIRIGHTRCVLPPTMAAWIPSGLWHQAETGKPFAYRSLYFDPAVYPSLPRRPQIIAVSPLLRELIVRVAEWPLSPLEPEQERLVEVLLDEAGRAPEQALSLPLPQDRRLLRIAEQLLQQPGGEATLEQLAAQAGASSRTVNRLFQQQTGLGFSAWRRQLKIMEASRLLAEGESVSRVATELGYAQDSAFIAMFRRHAGLTPGQLKRLL